MFQQYPFAPTSPGLARDRYSYGGAPSSSVSALWYIGSFALSIFSTLIGTTVTYSAFQLSIFLLVPTMCRLGWQASPAIALVLILTFAKNFLISQPIKLLLLQPADSNLADPIATVGAVLCALIGTIFGLAVWRWLPIRKRLRSLIEVGDRSWSSSRLGNALVIIGLLSRVANITLHFTSVVFHYVAFLTFAGAICYIVKLRQQHPQRLFDWRSAIVLLAYGALGLGSAGRTEILAPLAFAGTMYIYFRVIPHRAVLVGFTIAIMVLVGIVSPVINYARMRAGSDGVGRVFLEELFRISDDPAELSVVQNFDDRLEQSYAGIGRLYYGRQLGLADRFTPNQVDQLVSTAQYEQLGDDYILSGFGALSPQTFGTQRVVAVGQWQLESARSRSHVSGENFANYGLIGTLYLYRGNLAVMVGFAIMTILMLLLLGLQFGGKNGLFALIFVPQWMFLLADGNWSSFLISVIHGSIITGGALLAVIILAGALERFANPTKYLRRQGIARRG